MKHVAARRDHQATGAAVLIRHIGVFVRHEADRTVAQRRRSALFVRIGEQSIELVACWVPIPRAFRHAPRTRHKKKWVPVVLAEQHEHLHEHPRQREPHELRGLKQKQVVWVPEQVEW